MSRVKTNTPDPPYSRPKVPHRISGPLSYLVTRAHKNLRLS